MQVIPTFLLVKGSKPESILKPRDTSHHFDLSSIEAIRNNANLNGRKESSHQKMMEKKEQLHAESIKKAQTWGNTIRGDRKKLLEAADVEAATLEDRRLKIDAAWDIVKEEECRLALERAKSLRYNNDNPKVRELNSKLLMLKVLEERDLQLLHRKKREQMMKQREFETESNLNMSPIDELKREGNKWSKERSIALKIAKEQGIIVREKKKKILNERIESFKIGKLALEKEQKELAFLEAEKVQKRENQVKELQKDLNKNLEEKRQLKILEEIDEKAQKEDRDAFKRYKILLEARRADIQRKKLEDRIKVTDHVSTIQYKLDTEAKKKTDTFINALSAHNFQDGFKTPTHKSKIAKLEESNAYRLERILQSKKIEDEIQQTKLREHNETKVEMEAVKKLNADKKAKKIKAAKEISQFIESQREALNSKNALEKALLLKDNDVLKLNLFNENLAFEKHLEIVATGLGMQEKIPRLRRELKIDAESVTDEPQFPWLVPTKTFHHLGFMPN